MERILDQAIALAEQEEQEQEEQFLEERGEVAQQQQQQQQQQEEEADQLEPRPLLVPAPRGGGQQEVGAAHGLQLAPAPDHPAEPVVPQPDVVPDRGEEGEDALDEEDDNGPREEEVVGPAAAEAVEEGSEEEAPSEAPEGVPDPDEVDLDDPDLSSDGEYDEFDYVRMGLTEAERQWALRIKEVVSSTPEFRSPPLSDMMIAQIALVSIEDGDGGNIEKAKERIQGLQNIRANYEVVDSLETGKDILRRFVQDILPGFALSFYLHPSEGSYVLVLDLTKFDMSIFSDPDKVLIWLKGVYYFNHCQNPDLSAVRHGMIYLAECQGYYWKSEHMFQVRAFQEWADVASGYPLHFTSIIHYHTGLFINLMTSIGKKFLPPRIAKKFLFGYVSEHGRLDQIYLVPSLEAANHRLLQRLDQALELRYQNEASFTL